MGVTIHFEGRLKDQASLDAVITLAKQFCEKRLWHNEPISDNHVRLSRVRDDQDWDYEGPVTGIAIEPHENSEPFRLEFDNDLYIQEYTKTQFAPLEIHIALIELLRLMQPYFEHLEIVDEGEYYETNDSDTLAHHINHCSEVLDEYLAQEDKYYGPIRLESKRIIDVMSRD